MYICSGMLIPLCPGAKMYAHVTCTAVSHNTVETHNWLSAFLSVAIPTGNSWGQLMFLSQLELDKGKLIFVWCDRFVIKYHLKKYKYCNINKNANVDIGLYTCIMIKNGGEGQTTQRNHSDGF